MSRQVAKKAGKAPSGPAMLESVGIVFSILDQLAAARRPLGVTELALLMNEPKPRVYRHLASMRLINVVEQDSISDKYRLGSKLVRYGSAASEQFDLRSIADPYLTQLRDQTGQTALLSVPSNGTALVVATVESQSKVCITVKPGNRVAGHESAQGRIVLAYSDEATRKRVLGRKLKASTGRSITEPAALAERLVRIRERLYETADGESIEGINVLAAPVFSGGDQGDELVGIIGIIGPSGQVPATPPPALLAEVHDVAAALSNRLNGTTYEQEKFGG